jgi:hypothetical protein
MTRRVLENDKGVRLTYSEEVYTPRAEVERNKANAQPDSSISCTVEVRLDQSVCFIMPPPNSAKQVEGDRVLVTFVHAARISLPHSNVNAEKQDAPAKK